MIELVILIDSFPANGIGLLYEVAAAVIFIRHRVSDIIGGFCDTSHGIIGITGDDACLICAGYHTVFRIICHRHGIAVWHSGFEQVAIPIIFIKVVMPHRIRYFYSTLYGIRFVDSLTFKGIHYLRYISNGVIFHCGHIACRIGLGQELPQDIIIAAFRMSVGICAAYKVSI